MSEPKRVSRGAAMYRELQRQNAYLLRSVQRANREVRALEDANANPRVELAAADALLGYALDVLSEHYERS